MLALAPFLDMFNHSHNAEVEVHIDYKRGVYVLRSMRPYNKYDHVLIKYGAHSNLKLLVEYGFITPDNPNDYFEFDFENVMESVKAYNFCFGKLNQQYFYDVELIHTFVLSYQVS